MISDFTEKIVKKKNEGKIVMLTCYDYQMAKILDKTDIDMILVGDSLGMVIKGEKDTKNVTVEEVNYHLKAVRKGTKNKPVIADMPINSFKNREIALKNALIFINSGADGVKIEGNHPEIISFLVKNRINVMGHIGLLPQFYKKYKIVGKNKEERERLKKDALEIEKNGTFSVVLESIPESLGKEITEKLKIPTIGIGAGTCCDGQILVINDILGMDPEFSPRYVKKYLNLYDTINKAVKMFSQEVKDGKYPSKQYVYE